MQAAAGEGQEAWRERLEVALSVLRVSCRSMEVGALPGPDYEPVERDLTEAHAQLLLAYDGEVDPTKALPLSVSHLERARSVLAAHSEADPVLAGVAERFSYVAHQLAEATQLVATRVYLPPAPPREQLASLRLPRLQSLTRPRLTPYWRFPPLPAPEVTEAPLPELPRPTDFGALEQTMEALKERAARRQERAKERQPKAELAPRPEPERPEPPPGFARDPLPQQSEEEFLRQSARLCFEEVTMVGMARLPFLDEPWRGMEILDQRMLSAIDALVALGPPAFSELERWVAASPAPEPFRVFAITMILGSLEGRDALAAAERAFYRVVTADPEAGVQFARALKLTAHPHAATVARRLLHDALPAHRALGLEVLAHHGAATPEELAWGVAAAEPALVAAALFPLAAAKHPGTQAAITRALTLPGGDVRRAVWRAMAVSGDPRLSHVLHQDLSSELSLEAYVRLGALGSQQDSELLYQQFSQAPSEGVIAALGWAGDARFIEPLMQVLKGKDKALAQAAALALERLTRAGLFIEVEVPPEELEGPPAPEPNTGEPAEPLVKVVSDPRDLPDPGSPDLVLLPTTDFNRWHRWWRDHSARFTPGTRYRRGVPYSPLVSWNELDAAPCTPGERRVLQEELISRTGSYVAFDVEEWVYRQEAALALWEPLARAASGRPGAWVTPSRRP